MFTVVRATTRSYGYAIKVPTQYVTWAMNPDGTFGWYKRKCDAQKRVDTLNKEYRFNR